MILTSDFNRLIFSPVSAVVADVAQLIVVGVLLLVVGLAPLEDPPLLHGHAHVGRLDGIDALDVDVHGGVGDLGGSVPLDAVGGDINVLRDPEIEMFKLNN